MVLLQICDLIRDSNLSQGKKYGFEIKEIQIKTKFFIKLVYGNYNQLTEGEKNEI
jgi:hypothetical protein